MSVNVHDVLVIALIYNVLSKLERFNIICYYMHPLSRAGTNQTITHT